MRGRALNFDIIPYPKKIAIIGTEDMNTSDAELKLISDPAVAEEGFRIDFDGKVFKVYFADESGKFYALQTVEQIRALKKAPAFKIEDSPEYEYRGFSLDCARHSFTVDEIKRLIDTAAMFRLNRFHWHLTDDQGWRIETDGKPRLNETGSVRKSSDFGGRSDKRPYRALFSKDEIRDITAYCRERRIEVIPEIDIPGHASAILASYPNLGCSKEPVEVQTKQGIYNNILCVSNEEVYKFVFDILDEVCELFPFEYVHIGGDETPTKSWENCPRCRRMKEDLGLESFSGLQGIFMKRVADYLKGKGKKAIVWNESLKGGILTPEDVTVQRWMGGGNSSYKFAEAGGRVIESDFFHYYCDYPFGMTPLKKTYNYEPAKKYRKCGAQKPYGIEAEIWTEYISDFDTLCRFYFPRMAAIAEAAWGSKTSYKDFTVRYTSADEKLKALGINSAPEKDRDLNPLLRIPDIIKFFSGSLNLGMLKDHMEVS